MYIKKLFSVGVPSTSVEADSERMGCTTYSLPFSHLCVQVGQNMSHGFSIVDRF